MHRCLLCSTSCQPVSNQYSTSTTASSHTLDAVPGTYPSEEKPFRKHRGKLFLRCLLINNALKEAIIFAPGYQFPPMASTEISNTIALDKGWQIDFEKVFKEHFKGLHSYAFTIIKDDIMAEEMVQNVFFKLWEKKGRLEVNQSVAAYLYRAVYNESLNYLKHLKVRDAHQAYVKHQPEGSNSTAEHMKLQDLQRHLDKAMAELPEQCRTVFQMSRFEELKYHEIATRLNISVKTVENHMGKALRLLREKLADFLPALLLILLNL